MSIADKAIAEIENADDAGMVAYRIMRHFGLAGTVFTPKDIKSRLDDYDIPEDEQDGVVSSVLNSHEWRYIDERTTEVANEIVDDMVIRHAPTRQG